jgi:hypothetical protein
MTWQHSGTSRCLLLALGAFVVAAGARAEEATVEAFSVYRSEGELARTGPKSATFAGTATGLFFVQTTEGPGRPSQIVCPSSIEVDLETGAQTGKGKCTIENRDGESVFADWTCKGYHLVGCRGDFTLTGGTGRFQGVSGGGKMTVRSDLHEISLASANTISRTSQGVIWWEKLRVEMP